MKKKITKRNVGRVFWAIVILSISVLIVATDQLSMEAVHKMLWDLSYLFIFALSFVAQILLHEGGHFIGGVLSGYCFVSFRIGSFILVKEEGKLRIKRFHIPGTGGQCLLMPPNKKNGSFPFVLYNMGGSLLNLLSGMFACWVAIMFWDNGSPQQMYLLLFAGSGLVLGLANGIPSKISGIANDGMNMFCMGKEQASRDSFYTQLWINGQLSQGTRLRDINYIWFKLPENIELCNPLHTAVRLLEYNWYQDQFRWEEAQEVLNTFVPILDGLIPIYQYEVQVERIFLELRGENRKEKIDLWYTKEVQKYVDQCKFSISKKRFLLAYEWFYKKNQTKAKEIFEVMKSLEHMYPIKGEALLELEQAASIIGAVRVVKNN